MATLTMAATAQKLTKAQKASMEMMCKCQIPIVQEYWNEYSGTLEELGTTLMQLPKYRSQDGLVYNAKVYAHYFGGATDIFITEREGELMFGYAILNGDCEMSEFGDFSLEEIRSLPLELDFHWEIKSLKEALQDTDDYFDGIK